MELTPTQQRLYDVLSDGGHHTREELVACLWDDASSRPTDAVKNQIARLRTALLPRGLDVVARGNNGAMSYRLMRPIGPGE